MNNLSDDAKRILDYLRDHADSPELRGPLVVRLGLGMDREAFAQAASALLNQGLMVAREKVYTLTPAGRVWPEPVEGAEAPREAQPVGEPLAVAAEAAPPPQAEPEPPATPGGAEGYVVETEDLWRVYQIGSQQVAALRGVNLRVEAGCFVALKGRSGSGKTTLLNCLGGLDRPTSGVARVFGRDLSALDDRQLTQWRRKRVGFVFQSFGLLPTLSAYENVELVARLAGVSGKERHERTRYCLNLVGLRKWANHRPYELSGGQQQRVAIARALANQPQLILADEPTGELDSVTAREILGLFRQIVAQEHVTVLMASHDALVDEQVDQIVRLQDGQIVTNGNHG